MKDQDVFSLYQLGSLLSGFDGAVSYSASITCSAPSLRPWLRYHSATRSRSAPELCVNRGRVSARDASMSCFKQMNSAALPISDCGSRRQREMAAKISPPEIGTLVSV